MPRRFLTLAFVALGTLPLSAADPAPLDPRGLPGPLVIAGGGKLPADVRAAFFDLAGKGKAKIVVVPTASIDADDAKKAGSFLKQWEELKPASVVLLHTRDAKTANDPAFVKPLADATAVWFSGGDQNRLTAAYRGTLVEKELHKLHARGAVIGGTSAGAAVMTDLMIAGGTDTAKLADGFGFLPGFVADQHFVARKRAKRLEGVIAAHPARVGLGLDEGTALVVRGRTAEVVGASMLTVCVAKGAGKPAANDEYEAGALLDLVQLQRAALNRASKEPFPPTKAQAAEVVKGSLVIGGGGVAADVMWKRFVELAGADATVVLVTTAMDDPDDRRRIPGLFPEESAEEEMLKKYGAKSVVVLHTRDRKAADDPKFSAALLKAKGVWFGSGRQWRLIDSYEGTLTEKRVRDVLARGGVIGGGSAGASVMGEFMPRGHPLGNTVMAAEGYERGFGFLPGCAVDQHFFARERFADMTGLMKQYPQYLGVGIDAGAAVVVTGSVAEVIGGTKAKVAFYDARKKPAGGKDYEEATAGEKYDLKERKRVK